MELLINGEYENVGFWSFMKCSVLTSLALTGIIWGTLFIIGILLAGVFG